MMKTVKLIKKEYLDKNDVYDIEVNKTHSYVLENGIVSHNSSLEFTPSVVIAMNKRKLKEDEFGNKTTDVQGIKVDATVRKTRYTQPFQKITFNIPWDTGMDGYSGLFELFTDSLYYGDKPVICKEGSYCSYYSPISGEQIWKKYRKNITNEDYDMIMNDYEEYQKNNTTPKESTSKEESEIEEEI